VMTPDVHGLIPFVLVIGVGFLWFRAMFKVEIPTNRARFIAAMAVVAVLAISALMTDAGLTSKIPAGFAALGSALFLFTFAISKQKAGTAAIAVGDVMPEFSAVDEHGKPFDSSSLTGHPVLIKFFRGHW